MQYRFVAVINSTDKPYISEWFEVGDMHILNEQYFYLVKMCHNITLELKGDEKSEQND